jgi:hypothetical protein
MPLKWLDAKIASGGKRTICGTDVNARSVLLSLMSLYEMRMIIAQEEKGEKMNRRIKKKKAKQEQEVINGFIEKLLTNEQAFETLSNAVYDLKTALSAFVIMDRKNEEVEDE